MIKERTRNEIEEKYKWDLSFLYKNDEEYNNDVNKLQQLINKLSDYEGKLTSSSDTLYNYLKLDEEISIILGNLYIYASCKYNEDVSVSSNGQ